jgi:hypothetical protein
MPTGRRSGRRRRNGGIGTNPSRRCSTGPTPLSRSGSSAAKLNVSYNCVDGMYWTGMATRSRSIGKVNRATAGTSPTLNYWTKSPRPQTISPNSDSKQAIGSRYISVSIVLRSYAALLRRSAVPPTVDVLAAPLGGSRASTKSRMPAGQDALPLFVPQYMTINQSDWPTTCLKCVRETLDWVYRESRQDGGRKAVLAAVCARRCQGSFGGEMTGLVDKLYPVSEKWVPRPVPGT